MDFSTAFGGPARQHEDLHAKRRVFRMGPDGGVTLTIGPTAPGLFAPRPLNQRTADRGVALLTEDPEIQAAVRSAVATLPRACQVTTLPAAAVGAAWSGFDSVLLGPDAIAGARAFAGARTRPLRVAVVEYPGRSSPEVRLRDVPVMTLPGDRADLVSWLGLVEQPRPAGPIAVVGGRGGAGATTAAVALARALARRNGEAVLVDADPLGGGVDLALGGETVAGVRWPELAEFGGALAAQWLLAALPRIDGISVVSHARRSSGRGAEGEIGADTVVAVLDACSAQVGTVVDLSRHDCLVVRAVLARCGVLVVVVPAEVRACAAAAAVIDCFADGVPDVRLLIRGPSPAGLDAQDVAQAVGVPTFAEVRAEPGLAGAVERGDHIAVSSRSPLRRWADTMSAGWAQPTGGRGGMWRT